MKKQNRNVPPPEAPKAPVGEDDLTEFYLEARDWRIRRRARLKFRNEEPTIKHKRD